MSVDIHVGAQGIQHEHISFGDLREKSEIEVGALQMQILWSLSRKGMHDAWKKFRQVTVAFQALAIQP